MRRWILTAALLLAGSSVSAQDVLGADEWDSIMRATAPQQAEAKTQQARTTVEETPRGRKARARDRAAVDTAAASVEALRSSSGADARDAVGPEPKKPRKRGKQAAAGGKLRAPKAAGSAKTESSQAAAADTPASEPPAEQLSGGDKGAPGDNAAIDVEAASVAVRAGKGAQGAESPKGGARSRGSKAMALPAKPARLKRDKNDRGVPANYVALKRSWHTPWAGDSRAKMAGLAPALVVHPVHPIGANQSPYVLLPEGTDGGFNDAQVAVASLAWGSWPGGPRVSRRLLDLIYHAAMHFDVFHVHLVSGVRHDRGGSRHSHGLAADIVLPGVEDEELASYFRAQGFCGVGIYTRAGFVHIDTRDKSYFWLDWSLPGRKNRQQQIRGEEAKVADDAALARGQDAFVNPPKLQRALEVRLRRRRGKGKSGAAQATIQQGS